MPQTSTSGFIAGKPIKPEIAQNGRHSAQMKAHNRLSDEHIRNHRSQTSTSGFIDGKSSEARGLRDPGQPTTSSEARG